MSNGKHLGATARQSTFRAALTAGTHAFGTRRLAKGAVAAVLAASLCTTVAVQATAASGAGGSRTTGDSAAVISARTDAVDVASDALAAARTVQADASTTQLPAGSVAPLHAALDEVNRLIAKAGGPADTLTPDTTTATAAATPAATADAGSTTADPAAAPTDPATAAPGTAADTPEDAPVPGVTAPATTTPDPSAAAAKDPSDPTTIDPGALAALTVPTVPKADGPEDATTAQLRAAVAQLAHVAGDVKGEVSAKVNAAHAKAKADADAATKAAADAQTAAAAQAEAAAQAAAAQRAAWKASLQGFPNGKIPASALCGVSFASNVQLRCDAADALNQLDAAFFQAFGRHLEITDSYRSYGAQVACRAQKGNLCAMPGTSNHGWGVAVDFGSGIQGFGTAEHNWMNANAGQFQWAHPSWAEPGGGKPEPWHWEYVG